MGIIKTIKERLREALSYAAAVDHADNQFPKIPQDAKAHCLRGTHDFGMWYQYGYTMQRRKCKDCGLLVQRDI